MMLRIIALYWHETPNLGTISINIIYPAVVNELVYLILLICLRQVAKAAGASKRL